MRYGPVGRRVGRELLSRVPRPKLYYTWLNNQADCSLTEGQGLPI